ncbi:MAG: hypothetical protein NVSMB1_19930 [Polyangiales bacterium]
MAKGSDGARCLRDGWRGVKAEAMQGGCHAFTVNSFILNANEYVQWAYPAGGNVSAINSVAVKAVAK